MWHFRLPVFFFRKNLKTFFVQKHPIKPFLQRVTRNRLLGDFVKNQSIFHCYNRCDIDVITVIPAYLIKNNKLTRPKTG